MNENELKDMAAKLIRMQGQETATIAHGGALTYQEAEHLRELVRTAQIDVTWPMAEKPAPTPVEAAPKVAPRGRERVAREG